MSASAQIPSAQPHMTVTKLAPLIGAEISGIDLSTPLDAGSFAAIERAWHDHGVLLFRQQNLDDLQQVHFAERFGELAHTLKHFEGAAHPSWLVPSTEVTAKVSVRLFPAFSACTAALVLSSV